MHQTFLFISERVKSVGILLLSFILLLFQASSCYKNKDNSELSALNIGELSDAKEYEKTLTDVLKDKIASMQNKIVSNTRLKIPQSAGSETIGTIPKERHNHQILNQKSPNQEVFNQDEKNAKVYDKTKLILTDLYRIFYTLYKSSQMRPMITLAEYSFNVMRNFYVLCLQNHNSNYLLKEERALYNAIKEYYREPIDEYINGNNPDFTIVEKSVKAGRTKVKEALAELLNNKEYIKKENNEKKITDSMAKWEALPI